MLLGLFMLVLLILPTTRIPWQWYGALARPGNDATEDPSCLVLMGGGGVPSESGLVRSWKASEAAKHFPNAMVVVAMPIEPGEILPGAVERELIMRGVEEGRLIREPQGRNTREQALEVRRLLVAGEGDPEPVVGLVTSPEHMKRTWKSFQAAGFDRLVAIPGWPEEIKADLRYDEGELGAPSLGGAVGGNSMLKYQYWDNLGLLIKCLREEVAMLYYRLMGWI